MLAALIAAAIAASAPTALERIAEARHALAVGRHDQARAMAAEIVATGAGGEVLDRLLADLAFVTGKYEQALAQYETLMLRSPREAALAERAGLAALRLRDLAKASALLRRATAAGGAGWQAWNGLGIIADRQGDWAGADRAYAAAAELASGRAEVANNQGWSLLLRGQWGHAIAPLERAAALDPESPRIAANLDLARAALADGLPQRRSGESAADWAARLNDAGVVAGLRGDRTRAIAAFARAIEARTDWFERAANNLAALEPPR